MSVFGRPVRSGATAERHRARSNSFARASSWHHSARSFTLAITFAFARSVSDSGPRTGNAARWLVLHRELAVPVQLLRRIRLHPRALSEAAGA